VSDKVDRDQTCCVSIGGFDVLTQRFNSRSQRIWRRLVRLRLKRQLRQALSRMDRREMEDIGVHPDDIRAVLERKWPPVDTTFL